MQPLYFYTEELFFLGKLKRLTKKIIGKNFGGPLAVERSLFTGLRALGQPFYVNKPLKPGSIVCVLNGVETLRWALLQKSQGIASKIIAGPNIVVTPRDHNGIIMDPLIDTYIVPAQWSVDWWTSLEKRMGKILKVWPAGVEDKGILREKEGHCLVYKKTVPESLFQAVIATLAREKIKFRVIEYGKFTPEEYFSLLCGASFMVYLTEHESQGIALNEAWMGDVPTLVWNSGGFKYADREWKSEKISAPWLTDMAGMVFTRAEDFNLRLKEFLSRLETYKPRDYSLANFTDKKSAQRYLEIINGLLK